MSFRNISSRQSYDVIRTRSPKRTDERKWRDVYPPQVSNIKKVRESRVFSAIQRFSVANWVPIVVGITAAIGAGIGGFYIGEKYSTANLIKKMAKKATHLLPKKMRKFFKK